MSWTFVPASELMVKRGGSLNPAKFPDETFELLSIPSFDKNQPEILKGSEIGSSKSCIEPGDVLLSKIVPHIRRCWIVPTNGDYRQIGSGEWIIFRDKRFDPRFLKHFFTSDVFHRQFMSTVAGVGGSLVRARPADVERIDIPLPPLHEQKRIATILDKADTIRRKRQRATQLADQFLRAMFLDMFGDPVINPKGWEHISLRDLIRDWRPGVTIRPDEFTDSGFHVLHKGAVQKNGRVEFDSKKKTFTSEEFARSNSKAIVTNNHLAVNLRDLVPTGPSIGLMADLALYEDKFYLLAYGAYGFEVDRDFVSPDYLVALTNQESFRKELSKIWVGSTQIHIRKDDFFDIRIPFPDFELQKKYQMISQRVRAYLTASRESFHGDGMFASLSQKAFQGKL